MIVWGGYDGLNDGGRYNPAGDSWVAVGAAGAPAGRQYHTAVWTGSEMIVWGGRGDFYFDNGGRYNPAANTWSPVATAGAPTARIFHTAVWTGNEMIVWGGFRLDQTAHSLSDGARYRPAVNSWTPLAAAGAPTGRDSHTAVWTGSEMIVWGGEAGIVELGDGARYNPAADHWTAVTTESAPVARSFHTAVWTGSEMIISGGRADARVFGDTFSYQPRRAMSLYQRP
jgi:N-acetylneuraminic acid mutarotase